MIPLYDAHNHLQDERLTARVDEILRELSALGVKGCVVNGTCEKDWLHVEALAKQHAWIIPAFGLHPWFIKERSSNWFDTLRQFLDRNAGACIGEIGLDRWMRDPNVDDQEKVFVAQLELAADRNVSASIHCLKAWGHLIDLLKRHRQPERGFLIHSFGGSTEMAASLAKRGGYFSISGYFAHERKSGQRAVFEKIPIDRLLVETDAPDMLPPPTLIANDVSEVNDPRNLPKIYDFAANLLAIPLPNFADQMERNFQKLFT